MRAQHENSKEKRCERGNENEQRRPHLRVDTTLHFLSVWFLWMRRVTTVVRSPASAAKARAAAEKSDSTGRVCASACTSGAKGRERRAARALCGGLREGGVACVLPGRRASVLCGSASEVPSQRFSSTFPQPLSVSWFRAGGTKGGVKRGARRASKTYSSQGAKKAPPPQNHPRLSPSRVLPLATM